MYANGWRRSLVLHFAFTADKNRRLMMYNNLTSLVILFPIMFLAREHQILAESPATSYFSFWLGMLVTGVFGFLINIAIFLQIKVIE